MNNALRLYIIFAGPTGQVLNSMVTPGVAINDFGVARVASERYIITLIINGNVVDTDLIASSFISIQCQSPTGTGTVTNVLQSPTATYNAVGETTVSFQIETQNVTANSLLGLFPILSYVDRPVVMVSLAFAESTAWPPQ